MNKRIEGTIVLDGLIEGRLPALPGAELKLREWVDFARRANLHLQLEIDGGRFSILADNAVRWSASIGPEPVEVIASALHEMLKVFPPAERGRVGSSLRSIEYRKGQEVQTLYAIRPDGTVEPQQRRLDVHTTAPRPPMSQRERLLTWLVGVLVILAAFGVSAIFVDYHEMWQRLRNQATPLSADAVAVDSTAFELYFTVESRRIGTDGASLVLTLRRKLPLTSESLSAVAATQPAGDLQNRLALEAVARGYVRAELFTADGRFLGAAPVRIAPLRQHETADIAIPLSREPRAASITLAY